MRTNRLLALALAAALTLTVAACGSSSSDSKAAPALSKSAFIKKADAICKKSDAEINKQADKVDGTDQKQIEAYYTLAATKSIEQIAKVRALGLPTADADKLDKTFSTFETAFKQIVKDPSTTDKLASNKGLQAAGKAMEAYGFKECGSST